MTRVALYARYSTDQQREASIADQLRLCRQRAASEGWMVIDSFSDQAVSGATLLRPGMQALLAGALAHQFDVVLAEALDRLSRDQEDIAAVYKRLAFAGVRIVTLSEGEVGSLHVGLKGTMNALFLQDLADKTRRGLRGRVEAGRSGGGLCYGYDVVPAGADGAGGRSINPAEATVVQRIFRAFAAGSSPRAIARDLNREGVPGPSGRAWMDTTIRGHVNRGTGLLNNELYIGRLVWNRLRYLKDPSTGRRVSRANPSSAWIVTEVPELRIIDEVLWQAVKAQQQAVADQTAAAIKAGRTARNRLNSTHRPKSLLAGLLVCGVCGGRYGSLSQQRYGCSNHYRKGTCANGVTVPRARIEARVLSGLADRLLAPDLVAEAVRAFHEEANRLNREQRQAAQDDRRELQEVERKLKGIISVIEDGGYSPALRARLNELEARREALEARLAAAPPELPVIHPQAAQAYASRVAELATTLRDPEAGPEALALVRSMIGQVVLRPGAKRGQFEAELHGELGALLQLMSGQQKGLTPAATGVRPSVVAGAGFEPATFRL